MPATGSRWLGWETSDATPQIFAAQGTGRGRSLRHPPPATPVSRNRARFFTLRTTQMLKWPLWILSKHAEPCAWPGMSPGRAGRTSDRPEARQSARRGRNLAEQGSSASSKLLNPIRAVRRSTSRSTWPTWQAGQTLFSKRYALETTAGQSVVAGVQESGAAIPLVSAVFGLADRRPAPARLHPRFHSGHDPQGVERGQFVRARYLYAGRRGVGLAVGGAALGSWWTVLPFIVAVAAAFAYNVRVMTFALKLET